MKPRETLIHEGVFAGFLLTSAVLFRETGVMGERALWFLLTAVCVNGILLRLRLFSPERASAVSVVANSLLAAWIIDATGGGASLFWPLFLLPLYTTGLSHPDITLPVGLLQTATLASLSVDAPALESGIKIAFLLLAAWAIRRAALRERAELETARARRRSLEAALRRLAERKPAPADQDSTLRDALARDADRLTVVLAAAQLLREGLAPNDPAREDAQRVLDAAREAARSVRSLLVRELAKTGSGSGVMTP